MRLIIVFLSVICLTAHAADPMFTPIGLRINGAYPGQSFEFEPISYKSGTTVDIHLATKGLIAIDGEASTITTFTDDLGNNLLNPKDGKEPKFGPFPKVNGDGTAALFDISSPQLPGKTARSIGLSGKLAIRTATAKEETINKHIKLIKGAKIAWGSKEFLVDDVRMDGALTVSVKTDADVGDIAALSVIDAAGKRTVGTLRMTNVMEIGGKRLSTATYEIEATGDTFDVAIVFWRDLKTVEVPFAVKIGLGL